MSSTGSCTVYRCYTKNAPTVNRVSSILIRTGRTSTRFFFSVVGVGRGEPGSPNRCREQLQLLDISFYFIISYPTYDPKKGTIYIYSIQGLSGLGDLSTLIMGMGLTACWHLTLDNSILGGILETCRTK